MWELLKSISISYFSLTHSILWKAHHMALESHLHSQMSKLSENGQSTTLV